MILADTGYFLALAQPSDALHSRAGAWASVVNEPVLVTEYVVWEFMNALSSPVDRPKAHVLLSHIRTRSPYGFLPATPELTERAVRLHAARPDKAWSLTDCASFVVMTEQGLTRALAYDRHFEQAGIEALLRRDPQ